MTVQELNSLFGKNVRNYRKKKGWTQAKLGEEIAGVTKQVISSYEKGTHFPKPGTLILIASILGVEPWKLFFQGECNEDLSERFLIRGKAGLR